ncbi:MAG: hypothetical protein QNJ49_14645 [Mastigocoleus sp. MO_167.B18]|nr:hypothetical protein [Mastigocoleus sp. MO_167.B18]
MSTKKGRYFEKGNKLGFTTDRKESLSATATLRLTKTQKEILKNTPDWQERLRQYIDSFCKDECD